MANKTSEAVIGCLIYIVCTLIVCAIVDALLALPITWALNTFTPWHLTYTTVFVVLIIISVLFGGGARRSK